MVWFQYSAYLLKKRHNLSNIGLEDPKHTKIEKRKIENNDIQNPIAIQQSESWLLPLVLRNGADQLDKFWKLSEKAVFWTIWFIKMI